MANFTEAPISSALKRRISRASDRSRRLTVVAADERVSSNVGFLAFGVAPAARKYYSAWMVESLAAELGR
jgi:hypothetical protein